MADKKISQLPLLENVSGKERIVVEKNQQNYSILAGDLMKSEDTSNLLLFDSGMPTNGLASEGAEMNSTSSAVISKVYNASSLYFACSRIGEATSYTEIGRLYVELKNDAGEVSKLDYVIPPNQTGVYFANLSLSPKIENPTSLKVKVTPTLNGAVIAQDISEMRLRIGDLTKDAGWEENPQFANSQMGNIVDALIAINGVGKSKYYHVGTNTAAYYDLGESFDGTNKYIEFDMEMEGLATSQYAGVFGVRNLDESGQNYCWSIRRLDTPSILWLNYSGVPMGEKVTFRFKGLELFANDISLGAGTEYPSSTIENAYLFSIHDVGDPLPLYMSNLFKLYDVRIYSMDGKLLNNYEPQADQSRKCSITGKVLEKIGDGYFDVVKY